jgi:hypothetical protein
MAQAMTLISSQVLGSATASVTFSSIPGTYRDLRLVIASRTTYTTNVYDALYVQINADSGANYNYVEMHGDGSTAGSASAANTASEVVGYSATSYSGNTQFGVTTIDFLDYAVTDKHKTFISRASDAQSQVLAFAGRWASTSAITSMVFTDNRGTSFVAGSSFYLYGIVG